MGVDPTLKGHATSSFVRWLLMTFAGTSGRSSVESESCGRPGSITVSKSLPRLACGVFGDGGWVAEVWEFIWR